MVMDVERRHLKINQVWIFQLDRQSRAGWCVSVQHISGFVTTMALSAAAGDKLNSSPNNTMTIYQFLVYKSEPMMLD